jgi:hypothetical protein
MVDGAPLLMMGTGLDSEMKTRMRNSCDRDFKHITIVNDDVKFNAANCGVTFTIVIDKIS